MAPVQSSPRPRRWLTPLNVVTLLVFIWAAPRLLPHVGAVVGIGSGGSAGAPFSSLRREVLLLAMMRHYAG